MHKCGQKLFCFYLQPSNYNESKCARQDVIVKDKCLKLRFRAISEFSETQVFDNGTLTIKDFGWSDRGRCTYSLDTIQDFLIA